LSLVLGQERRESYGIGYPLRVLLEAVLNISYDGRKGEQRPPGHIRAPRGYSCSSCAG